MKAASVLIVLVLALILLAGCAPGVNKLAHSADSKGVVAGFWRGLWNGILAPVT